MLQYQFFKLFIVLTIVLVLVTIPGFVASQRSAQVHWIIGVRLYQQCTRVVGTTNYIKSPYYQGTDQKTTMILCKFNRAKGAKRTKGTKGEHITARMLK